MSTIAQVQTAWQNYLWTDSTLLKYTDKILQYEVTTVSEAERALLTYDGAINFVEVVTTKSPSFRELGNTTQAQMQFNVDVRYTREKIPLGAEIDGDSYAQIQIFFETLNTKINSLLGASWQSTVDFWEFGETLGISSEEVDTVPCWRGVARFTAFQYATI